MLHHIRQRTRGYLPHWETEGATYFVTFRLADSLPQKVLNQIVNRRTLIEAARRSGRELLPAERITIEEFSSKKIAGYLDAGHGYCTLKDARMAESVVATLKRMDGLQYDLLAWCIMPNHVHVVFRIRDGYDLAAVVKPWKAVTTRRAKELLCCEGRFWMREYYDRLVRDEKELERAIDYVLQNPKKAGLLDWPWVWSRD